MTRDGDEAVPETSLDRFGRVVIPKTIRDELGLVAGDRLEVHLVDGAVVLRPLAAAAPLCVKEGVVVYCGRASGDLSAWSKAERARRMDGLSRPLAAAARTGSGKRRRAGRAPRIA